jgi:mono/diheme cytochrome c family protein
MKYLAVSGIVLFIVFGGFVTASAQQRGKTLYDNNCAECHGTTGNGDGPAAAALGTAPADFNTPKFWQGNVQKKIETAVNDGYGAMPPLDLSPDDLKTIIDYMSHTFKK